ncbi:DUF2489 domain-containing protein [Psychrobium sp. MM17-31]|uniref:DUF2489 domain-containing protein n=1 Tax=Psychrobium sp. MM17-31 TaxID=2917758 RepID=UPI001EF47421|nr:DUF2489 domain-containing protein [Psychrobium sp. MM17-31]MCG7533025.1 DUF2489 domain-containing protein [Psychrobium sp. MM17-31]
MTTLHIVLIVVALLIISGLAFYAGKLLAKVREQEAKQQAAIAEQQQKIAAHNQKLVESIRLIAKAIGEEQCEPSEGAIRICRLLEKIHVTADANFPTQYPALHELDSFLADYPTHEGYKALPRQERMRFDVKRAREEDRLREAINKECESLKSFDAPA